MLTRQLLAVQFETFGCTKRYVKGEFLYLKEFEQTRAFDELRIYIRILDVAENLHTKTIWFEADVSEMRYLFNIIHVVFMTR